MLHVLAFAAFLGLPGGVAQPTTQPSAAPTTRPVAATQPAAIGVSGPDGPRIEVILDRMEAMGNEVNDLRCRVEYRVEDLIGLSEFTKFGTIAYRRAKPNPRFFIMFDKMHEGGIVLRRKEWYLFRDRWLVEAKEVSRTTIRREIIREGETIDLFSLDKTPFPMPFGQHKDEILRHFHVMLVPPTPKDPPGTDHLVCMPKPTSHLRDDYSSLEFFVSRTLHLPVKIVAYEADPDGEPAKMIQASFPDLTKESLNRDATSGVFDLPPETREYRVIEEPMERPVSAPPSATP